LYGEGDIDLTGTQRKKSGRCDQRNEDYFSGFPKAAAATARQKSASSPLHLPFGSFEKTPAIRRSPATDGAFGSYAGQTSPASTRSEIPPTANAGNQRSAN
jgi:hypothetical protein